MPSLVGVQRSMARLAHHLLRRELSHPFLPKSRSRAVDMRVPNKIGLSNRPLHCLSRILPTLKVSRLLKHNYETERLLVEHSC